MAARKSPVAAVCYVSWCDFQAKHIENIGSLTTKDFANTTSNQLSLIVIREYDIVFTDRLNCLSRAVRHGDQRAGEKTLLIRLHSIKLSVASVYDIYFTTRGEVIGSRNHKDKAVQQLNEFFVRFEVKVVIAGSDVSFNFYNRSIVYYESGFLHQSERYGSVHVSRCREWNVTSVGSSVIEISGTKPFVAGNQALTQ